MTETTLPPAHRYQEGAQKTVTIDGETVTYEVMGGEWVRSSSINIKTIVVPAGQSFRIVDDADTPSMIFTVSNSDPVYDNNAFSFMAQWNDGTSEINISATQDTNTESEYYGHAVFIVQQANTNGTNILNVDLAADGTSSFISRDCSAFEPIQYSDTIESEELPQLIRQSAINCPLEVDNSLNCPNVNVLTLEKPLFTNAFRLNVQF